jgi:indolepyruvate decarboxylase
VITVWPDYVQIGGTTFGAVYLADVLERLTQALPKTATPRIPKPAATPVSGSAADRVSCRQVLGGLISEYRRAA